MSVEGIRVVRGPDWHYGDDDDGGEGHVGTVTQDNEDNTVEVQWDMGNSGTYDTGNGGKCDLRVLDSAPAGLKHAGILCDGCNKNEFPGTRWKCQTCDDFDLCTICYFNDKHDLQHPFVRMDFPGCKGMAVPKRSISKKARSLGIFPGAKVKRGVDWNGGKQDGGEGNVGKVVETRSYGTTGPERDSVSVKWAANDGVYRLGYRGKVDLQCVEEAPGVYFYKMHLYPMNTSQVQNPTTRPMSVVRPSLRRQPSVVKPSLQPGDEVCVALPEIALKEVQRGHGGWSMRMKEIIGQHGKLKSFEDNGDVIIVYDEKEWRFNADAVMKVPKLKVGDVVRIMDDETKVQALQKRHGGWQQEMSEVIGKVGKVVKIDSDGDVAIGFGDKAWVFNPVCCLLAPGEKLLELEAIREDEGDSSSDDGDDGDDDEEDETAEALGHLIAQLMLLRGLGQAVITPQHLVGAAAKNDISTVKRILADKPALIDQKHQGLTALIISSHEGNIEVVIMLLKAGANTNLTEQKGNNALMAALMKKHEVIASLILKAGTNINTVNDVGRTALHFAASNGCLEILKQLLARGANPNLQDKAGDTPLHDAIQTKSGSAVDILLASPKINLTIVNRKGHPPLHFAAMKDDDSTVLKILKKSPDLINTTKADGYTPLHVAAINDNTDVIQVLLKLKAHVDPTDRNNTTPLHLSAHQGYLAATKLLVQASANVNIQDCDGDTALHNCVMARRNGGDSAVLARLLLGIRVSADGELKERTNVACYLIQNGASIDIRNKRGRNVLECCNDERMKNAIRMFAQKQGRPPSVRGSRRQDGATLADLFDGLPIPCMGCLGMMADVKFGPCGHKVCCKNCAFRVRDCPMCDTPITERYGLDGQKLDVVPCKVQ